VNEIYCRDRTDLLCAIAAIAEPTHESAKLNPATIYAGGATYKFPFGLHASRVRGIQANIRRCPRHIFESPARDQTNAAVVQSSIDVRIMPPEVRLSLRIQDDQGR